MSRWYPSALSRFLKRREPSRPRLIRPRTRKLTFELLEDRTLLSGQSLIVNGDFSLGNTGFTTGYTYSPGDIGPAGSYDVVDNPAHSRPHDINPAAVGDHTTGTGLMLAANGAANPTTVVWSETVSVSPNSTYDFSLWLSSWFASSPATLDVRFNGISVGTPTAPSAVGVWQQFSTTWNSGSATSLTVDIIDTNPADVGSDFALDDISLTSSSPASSPVTLTISDPAPFLKPDSGQVLGVFVVTRSGDLAPAVQVDYATQDGTGANGAHAGTDYVATASTLSFAPYQTTATIGVPIIGNNAFQPDKMFTVSLSNPQPTALGFTPQQTFAVGAQPFSAAVGDFNGDGKPDLVTANRGSASVSVLLNTTAAGATTPTFAPQQTFAVVGDPQGVAVGDLNGDGKPDLAVANNGPNLVSVLLNTTPTGATTASFAPQGTFVANGNPDSVAVGDFNGDCKPDLAVSNGAASGGFSTVSVYLNMTPTGSSTPSFTPQAIFSTGPNPNVAVADFNGDGRPDLALDNSDGNTVSVLLNTTPMGSTTPSFAPQQTFPVGNHLSAIAVGDFNSDGRPDLVIASLGATTVSVLLNTTPTGSTTATFTPQQTFVSGNHPVSVAVGDFDGDGRPDLAVANGDIADVPVGGSDNTVSVLLNTTPAGATTASFVLQQTLAAGIAPRSVAVGDFNGDGKTDLAVANLVSATVSVMLNAPGGIALSGSPATGTISSALQAPPASLSGTVFEDFNGDGQVDFGEKGIAGVTVSLTGTDDLGHSVSLSQQTDGDGAYVFGNLRPGSYTITESQPAGYVQGINTVGTAGGTTADDQFFVDLAVGTDGINYNFGERPAATGPVVHGQTAGIGFWNNRNGQTLIKVFNGSTGTRLADWLAATLPHIFGKDAGANDLTGKSNADVASLFQKDFLVKGQKLDAQVLATALSVYATNATLDDTGVATKYGLTVSGDGVGTATFNVSSSGDAFGVANNSVLTVMDLLLATDAEALNGILYNGDKRERDLANAVYAALNQTGTI